MVLLHVLPQLHCRPQDQTEMELDWLEQAVHEIQVDYIRIIPTQIQTQVHVLHQ